jgi:hypothetical protein
MKSPLFMFVMEDAESGGVLGTSQTLASKMGGPGNPNVSFKLDAAPSSSPRACRPARRRWSRQMHLDESAPTEIGGLILQPSYRGHKKKLGRFLSPGPLSLHGAAPQDVLRPRARGDDGPDHVRRRQPAVGLPRTALRPAELRRGRPVLSVFARVHHEPAADRAPVPLACFPRTARAVRGGGRAPRRAPPAACSKNSASSTEGFVDPFDGGPHLDCATDDTHDPVQGHRVGNTRRAPRRQQVRPRRHHELHMQSDGDFFAVCEPFARRPRRQDPDHQAKSIAAAPRQPR